MKKNKKAFSIVELIVATSILTIGVFGISALLTQTQTNINNTNNYNQKQTLSYNIFECLKSKKTFSELNLLNIGDILYINFGNNLNKCNVLKYKAKTTINNLEYFFKIKIIEKKTNAISVKIFVDDKIFKIFKIFK